MVARSLDACCWGSVVWRACGLEARWLRLAFWRSVFLMCVSVINVTWVGGPRIALMAQGWRWLLTFADLGVASQRLLLLSEAWFLIASNECFRVQAGAPVSPWRPRSPGENSLPCRIIAGCKFEGEPRHPSLYQRDRQIAMPDAGACRQDGWRSGRAEEIGGCALPAVGSDAVGSLILYNGVVVPLRSAS